MLQTKKDVDIHVRSALAKIRNEVERNLRGLTIAKLYFKVKEYSSAEQYLLSYLSAKEDNDQAHKLLGKCYQCMKKPDKALQAFQRSLQLNPKQPDLLDEVCQLLLDDKIFNANKAKYWCDLAASERVDSDAVFSLRLKVLSKTSNMNGCEVEELLHKEIAQRPQDVALRVRLVNHYLERKQVVDAFKYVYNLEMSNHDALTNSSEWYDVVWTMLSKYEQTEDAKRDCDFWIMKAQCLDRQVCLSFNPKSELGGTTLDANAGLAMIETTNLIFKLDQCLFKMTNITEGTGVRKELLLLGLEHYRGQLLLHSAALLIQREQLQRKNRWPDTVKSLLPLLLMAFHITPKDNRENWMKHCDERAKQLINIWNRQGAFRCAQAGRVLLSCIDENTQNKENTMMAVNILYGSPEGLWKCSDDVLAEIREICANKQWRRNIFATLFHNSEQKTKENSSLLVKSPKLAEPVFQMPTFAEVEHFEEMAQFFKPNSLHHMVYLCLGNENLHLVRSKFFSGLRLSCDNLSYCGAESLNQLDIDTYFYASTIQARRIIEIANETFECYISDSQNNFGKPRILPFVNIKDKLCTEEQAMWWQAAYLVYKNLAEENLAELRANLQFGIQAVRGVSGQRADMIIVFKLGKILVERARVSKPTERSLLEVRAENLYKCGLNMLKMHNRGVLEPYRRYFKYAMSNTAAVERELFRIAEEAITYLSELYFKKDEYEELIEELSGVQLPFATYYQSEAYRKLDKGNKTPNKMKRVYLERARECLAQTVALLKNSQIDPNHPLLQVAPEELRRVDQSQSKIFNDSLNSSMYEDAENESMVGTPGFGRNNLSRSRRDNSNLEIENLVKQIANTLCFVKEELIDTIKPEMKEMRREIGSLKDKIAHLEDSMKKTNVPSNPPSRDDASNVLDDLYMIEDALQHQMYPQAAATTQQAVHNFFGGSGGVGGGTGSVVSPFPTSQQPRINTPNAMQAMQQNAAVAAVAAAAYNSPMFNPNYSAINYYGSPFMQGPPNTSGSLLGQRNPPAMPTVPALPYMDATANGMGFQNSLLPPPPTVAPQPLQTQTSTVDPMRSNTLFGLLTQQQQQQPQQNTQFSMPSLNLPQMLPTSTTTTTGGGSISNNNNNTAPPPQAPPSLLPFAQPQFNKVLNNQPVEKGPPANVVITSSDPLPNPGNAALQAQQPTLSVTIPSHHIKPSLVQQTTTDREAVASAGNTNNFVAPSPPSVNVLFNRSNNSLNITSNVSINTNTASAAATAAAGIPFSFKEQVAQATKQANAVAKSNVSNNETKRLDESISCEENQPEIDPIPDFKPIIALPDEIEVRTGEEDEEVKFCHRAKLYRHKKNEWKERGTGDLKILKNKHNGQSRVLMRQEKTHKICANHKITKEILISEAKNEPKGYMWAANDFADEEVKLERFLVRFKEVETAQEFYKAFKCAQKEAAELEEKEEKKKSAAAAAPSPAPFSLSKSGVTNFATSTPAAKSNNENMPPPTTQAPTPIATSLLSKPFMPVNKPTQPATTVSKSLFDYASATEQKDQKEPAVTPFAGFSFGQPSTISSSSAGGEGNKPFANLFSSLGNSNPSPFSTSNLPSLFQTAPLVSVGDNEHNKSVGEVVEIVDEYEPEVQFNPVITLPDLVEVSTGEENEIVLFEHRAKLLRLDKASGEWKERGIGNIKILQDKNDVNKVRLVMRREQVHKLCCNQRLYKSTSFCYAKNLKTALIWGGHDYSDNELVSETMSVRFKTAETCKEFHDAVLQAQSKMVDSNVEDISEGDAETTDETVEVSEVAEKEEEIKTKQVDDEKPKGFGDAFKPKPGSWNCEGCYCTNNADVLYCIACDTPKDNTVPKKEPENVLATKTNTKFLFGFNAAGGASGIENAAPPPPTTTTGFKFGSLGQATENSGNTVPSSGGLNFGFNAAVGLKNDNRTNQPTPALGAFTFAVPPIASKSDTGFGNNVSNSSTNVTKSFSFSSASTATTTTASTTTLSKPTFSFTLKSAAMEAPKIPTASDEPTEGSKSHTTTVMDSKSKGAIVGVGIKSNETSEGDRDDGGYHGEEEENNTYFAPVIPLPEKIDVVTGEEKEDVLYMHRAKLFRYIDSEWKERGLGDVKILRHKDTLKLRVIMRREQILKICLNHVLNEDVEYKRKDEKSWLFVVNDFSEGEVQLEKLSLRFKTKEIAEAFMEAVKNALDDKAVAVPVEPHGTAEHLSLNASGVEQQTTLKSDEALPEAPESENVEKYDFSRPSGKPVLSLEQPMFPALFTRDNSKEKAYKKDNKSESDTPTTVTQTTVTTTSVNQTTVTPTSVTPTNVTQTTVIPTSVTPTTVTQTTVNTVTTVATPISNFSFKVALNNGVEKAATVESSGGGAENAGKFVFGSSNTNNTLTQSSGSIFAGIAGGDKKPLFGGSLFGNATSNGEGKNMSTSIFGGNNMSLSFGKTGSFFGNKSDDDKSKDEKTANFLSSSSGRNIFSGISSEDDGTETTKLFSPSQGETKTFSGAGLFTNSAPASGVKPTIFGNAPSTFGNIFSNQQQSKENALTGSVFGGSSLFGGSAFSNSSGGSLFGNAIKANTEQQLSTTTATATSPTAPTPNFADLSSKAGTVDFASLAKSASATSATMNSAEKPGPGGFIGLTNQDAFSSFRNNNAISINKNNAGSNNSTPTVAEAVEEPYDPHYEPIIALPEEIVVRTGEENEKKLFGERATLFRYDDVNKEWKERGVGELKILEHNTNHTFRILLRREQIHKLVLNHRIGHDFTFNNFNNNPRGFVWGTLNYAESENGVMEKLAVRFKKIDVAEQFSAQLRSCIEAAKQQQHSS